MKTKRIILGFLLLLLFVATIITIVIFITFGWNNMRSKEILNDYSKIIESGNLDDLSLTIYYAGREEGISYPHATDVDYLINVSAIGKIVIDGNSLKEHIDLLKQLNADALKPVWEKSHLDARLYYVFETVQDGKILDVAFGGSHIDLLGYYESRVFVNGLEVREDHIFTDIIKPFLTEEATEELAMYYNEPRIYRARVKDIEKFLDSIE